jgi:GTPase SAR1 family protein
MPPEARQEAEPPSPDRPEKGPPSSAIAILVNGASSSGKTTFCRALQERLSQLADDNPSAAFARVALMM